MIKKEHRFFEKYPGIDVVSLNKYLVEKNKEMILSEIDKITQRDDENQTATQRMSQNNQNIIMLLSRINWDGFSTRKGESYNVFSYDYPEMYKLKNAIRSMVKEACEYYGVNYEEQKYMIHGWFNLEQKIREEKSINPVNQEKFFHDHLDGSGAPNFHGYYCVNAEPSITYYKINNEILFENINKNDRAILSETGHPHGRDDWRLEESRITIAYDVTPVPGGRLDDGSVWVMLD